MQTVLINPMDEKRQERRKPAARLRSLKGAAVALIDISKPGGDVFLDRLEVLLKQRFGVAKVSRETKPTFARPAPLEMLEHLRSAQIQAAVIALAD